MPAAVQRSVGDRQATGEQVLEKVALERSGFREQPLALVQVGLGEGAAS